MHPLKQYKSNRRRNKFLTRKLGTNPNFDDLVDDTLIDRMLEGERQTKRPVRKSEIGLDIKKVYSMDRRVVQ